MLKKLTDNVTKSWQTITIIIAVVMVGYNVANQQAVMNNTVADLTNKIAELSESVKDINQINSRVGVLEKALANLQNSHSKDMIEVVKSIILQLDKENLEVLTSPAEKAIIRQVCGTPSYRQILVEEIGQIEINEICNYVNK